MTKPIARDYLSQTQVEAEIIELCVRWYITYRLNYRDLAAMMVERGLNVSHTTIMRRVVRYVPEFEASPLRRRSSARRSVRMLRDGRGR